MALPITITSFSNEVVYPYIRLREEFGRQPRFLRDHHRVHCNIHSNRLVRKKYRRYRLLDKGVQAVKHAAETPMNTIRRPFIGVAFMHEEGGWPKDVNLTEPEMMIRHRKKLEKEENYQLCMPVMYEKMDRFLKQNNAVDLYGELFEKKWKHRDMHRKTPHAKTIQIFRDWTFVRRAVKKIIWAPENVGRMGVCHTPRKYDKALRDTPTEAYFWEVENASRPESMVRSQSHIMDIMYHPKDMHSLCGACFDGTVQFWDARIGPNPQQVSPLEISHQDVCSSAVWINSKTNTEFISAGLDGQVIWWDIRNLEEKLETTWCDPEKGQQREEMAKGATILEYDHSLPTKFIIGTEDGHVMVFMKKGKTPNDKLANCLKGHRGPVLGLQRNPMFIKNFLSVGDTNVRIFAEDVRDSSIMWTAPKNFRYTHAAWVPSRPSIFVVSRNDGHFDVYDLNKNPARPFTTVKVRVAIDPKRKMMSDLYLTYVAPCDAPSRLLAVGTSKGQIYMQRMSEVLFRSEKFDKPILAAAFERESRREKLIEQRHREIRLRKRDKDKMNVLQENIQKEREALKEQLIAKAAAEGTKPDVPNYSKNKKYDLVYEAKYDPRCLTEREFYMEIEKELQEKGIESWPDYRAVVEEETKTVEGEVLDVDAALDVTAADLAQYSFEDDEDNLDDYDDDGRPIEKKAPKASEAPPEIQVSPPPPPTPASTAPLADGQAPPPAADGAPPAGEAAPSNGEVAPPAAEDGTSPPVTEASGEESAAAPPPPEDAPPVPEAVPETNGAPAAGGGQQEGEEEGDE